MYTAKIIKKEKINGLINVDVEMSNDNEVIKKSFQGLVEAEQLNRNIERHLAILNQIDIELDIIKIGDWTMPEKTVEAPIKQTADELRAIEIANKEKEVLELAEKLKKEKELQLLSLENEELAIKIQELEVLKN